MDKQTAPSTEFPEDFVKAMGEFPGKLSSEFVNGMRTRMTISYFKYGAVADAYPHKVNAIESCQMRIEKYIETGNTEFLIDAGNFLMIETMCPRKADTFENMSLTAIRFNDNSDPLECLQECIDWYSKTGNKSFLAFAGRLAMQEFMTPQHSEAHFKATDASESPGRASNSLVVTHRANNEV